MNYTYLVDIIIQWPIPRHEIHSNGQLFFFFLFSPLLNKHFAIYAA